jgi:hypothetical protein
VRFTSISALRGLSDSQIDLEPGAERSDGFSEGPQQMNAKRRIRAF